MRVVTVTEMREIEQRAEAEHGLTSETLMEHAGRSVAAALRAAAGGSVTDLHVVVLVGPGNNGGDGRVAAKYLAQWGARISAYVWRGGTIESNGVIGPAGEDLAALATLLGDADVVLDALLGTGHTRPLAPEMRRALSLVAAERARRRNAPIVVAVDLPSGLNADTGAVDEGTIAADLTVTLACPKVGLFLFPGAGLVGELEVGDIGLPSEMSLGAGLEMLTSDLLRPTWPRRGLDSNKGTFGHVVVLGGSAYYVGAAYLAAAASGRAGAGLIVLAVEPSAIPTYAAMLPEAIYAPLAASTLPAEDRASQLMQAIPGARAMVIGPGLSPAPEVAELLAAVFAAVRAMPAAAAPRLIVDASALSHLAKLPDWWQRLPAGSVLTPHPGEMSRLLGGAPVSGGGVDRLVVARETAAHWGHVIVL
ncbi:MAG TPA: NAD(P)H-hydrate epimerase, partial [Ktedonobacterales bacterium]